MSQTSEVVNTRKNIVQLTSADKRQRLRRLLFWPIPGILTVIVAVVMPPYASHIIPSVDWSLIGEILESLGAALIAAGIAVPAIELRANDRLTNHILLELQPVTTQLHEHIESLIELASDESAKRLTAVLSGVFKHTPPDARLFTRTFNLIDAVQSSRKTVSWTDNVTYKFIGELLKYVSDNAVHLAAARKTGNIQEIELPKSSAFLAASILATQMAALDKGDRYTVLSDLSSWRDGLDAFHAATVEAISKGVRVRRLLCPHGHDNTLSGADVERIIRQQWEASLKPNARDDVGRPLYELGVVRRTMVHEMELRHIGIFRHKGQGVSFEPVYSDLSRMRFSKTDSSEPEGMAVLWNRAIHNFKARTDKTSTFEDVPFEIAWEQLGAEWWKRT